MSLLIFLTWLIWETYWTIKGCWLAAKRDDKLIFIAFLFFPLLGIPEIIYIRKYSNSDKTLH
tara:strand:+ start:558 stop:743 length:186 start_codon:yes stop_codon:yes gene_type:complete